MNLYSILATLSVFIVTVLCERKEHENESGSKNTTTQAKDDCNANLSCTKCLQFNSAQSVHCYFVLCDNGKKGLCTTATKDYCEGAIVASSREHCGEHWNPVTSGTTNHSASTTAATIPVPSTRDGTGTGKGFSGPSFIGGIVLAFGLMAIAVVVFKFYKARTEANYHTL